MPVANNSFEDFLQSAGPEHTEFIEGLHQLLLENHYSVMIKEAKSGYVVSYLHTPTKRTVANYVFRKKGPLLRIYADNISGYTNLLDAWPEAMKSAIRKAGPCKRLIDSAACNPHCIMGFDFVLGGEKLEKCRNNCFMFYLEDLTKPFLREMMEREINARS